MRITCPNCEAQYEVPDDIVPEEGRDVQCSSCGQTWFQEHPDFAGAAQEEYEAEAVMPEPEPLIDEPEDDEDYQESPIESPPRRELDPGVEEILREEAAREAAVRTAESAPENLETQPGLGLEARLDSAQEDARMEQMSARVARMRGQKEQPASENVTDAVEDIVETVEDHRSDTVDQASAAAAALASRKDLLPDIEEINSTLRSTGDRAVAGDDTDPEAPIRNRKKRGFRRGFMWAVVLFLIALLIYIFAPQIAEAVPQADPLLSNYVSWVDGLRSGLDTRLQSVLKWLDDTAAASGDA